MAAKAAVFPFRYSVKAEVLFIECDVEVAISFKEGTRNYGKN
jgi:hypothetical protein